MIEIDNFRLSKHCHSLKDKCHPRQFPRLTNVGPLADRSEKTLS